MEDEIKSFIKVWIASIASICYCYFIVRHLPRGITRFLFLVPIFYVFIVLPYNLHSIHLGGPTLLYLVWLANFKLLLFAFNQGPLVDSIHPSKSLLRFISTALLPIKIKKNPPPKSYQKSQNPNKTLGQFSNGAIIAVKAALLGMVISLYDYREHWHHYFIIGLYILHLYLGIELGLAMSGAVARAFLIPGVEIERQFDEPFLATSLQDFWGRRWNLMVSSILRPTVYDPVRRISIHIFGRKWASLPAMAATFLVSGLMHEVTYFYMTRASPTWEVTWFFVLHGACTVAEVVMKKAVAGRWRLHRVVSGPLTIGFVAATASWLFFPQILRNGVDQKVIRESSILLDYVKGSFVENSRLLRSWVEFASNLRPFR